jgi:hypothetical protein
MMHSCRAKTCAVKAVGTKPPVGGTGCCHCLERAAAAPAPSPQHSHPRRPPSTLHDQDLVGPSHRLGCELGIGEPRVLAYEICFNHPTGGRAGLSNKYRNLVLDDARESLSKRGPAHGRYGIRYGRPNENCRITGYLDSNVVASRLQRRRPDEGKVGSRWVFRAAQAHEQELLRGAACRDLLRHHRRRRSRSDQTGAAMDNGPENRAPGLHVISSIAPPLFARRRSSR